MIRKSNNDSHIAPSTLRDINLNVEKSIISYELRLRLHQNNTATGIIIIRRSRANEPSQPRYSNRLVFMCASGGACCRWANQYRIRRRRQRLRANVCSGKNFWEQMFQRPNSALLSRPYGPTSPRSTCRSAWAFPNATRSRSCAANGASRHARCMCSMPKFLIEYRANAQTICGTIAGTDPSSCAVEGMKRCASRLAAGRTAVARGASVAPARTNTLARPVVAAPRPASSCVRGSSPGSWRGNARCCWRAEAQRRAGISRDEEDSEEAA